MHLPRSLALVLRSPSSFALQTRHMLTILCAPVQGSTITPTGGKVGRKDVGELMVRFVVSLCLGHGLWLARHFYSTEFPFKIPDYSSQPNVWSGARAFMALAPFRTETLDMPSQRQVHNHLLRLHGHAFAPEPTLMRPLL